ncbi:hypothetical protein F5876DRAFT_83482 [Lentinula aff. lateritia]|uniref:Uncharacterized protein n=1 Tax=Lentinula aff. lateritia TaxID=2804960 RepID=A0ACC1THZ7_9AGAR|nr:hypothetical protein F5876DRAFT_83482 [Lentinula aff. lateritia]
MLFSPIPTLLLKPRHTSTIAIAKSSRGAYTDVHTHLVVPRPIQLPRLLQFELDFQHAMDDIHNDQNHNQNAVPDSDPDSDSESTTSSTSHLSDVSSMTSVSSASSHPPTKSPTPYIPPHRLRLPPTTTPPSTASASAPEHEPSIPSHRLLAYSHTQHRLRRRLRAELAPRSAGSSHSLVCRYKYQDGETRVVTGGVMLGSAPAPATRPAFASTRPPKRRTARALILGPDSSFSSSPSSSSSSSSPSFPSSTSTSSSSLHWRQRRLPSVQA